MSIYKEELGLRFIVPLAVSLAITSPVFGQQISGQISSSAAHAAADNDGVGKVVVTPQGQKVYLGLNFQQFAGPLMKDLEELKKLNPVRYQSIMKGMAKTIALKNIYVDPTTFASGIPVFDFYQDIEIGSEKFFLDYYQAVAERTQNGVTFDSIVKIGQGYEANAAVAYQNAVKNIYPEFDQRSLILEERRQQVESMMGRVSIIKPMLYQKENGFVFEASMMNDAGVSLKGMSVSVQPADLTGQDQAAEYGFDIHFEDGFASGEFRQEWRYDIQADLGDVFGSFDGGKPVRVTVERIETESGHVVTGREYDEVIDALAAARQRLEVFERDVQMELGRYAEEQLSK